jgi:hypothetical protein
MAKNLCPRIFYVTSADGTGTAVCTKVESHLGPCRLYFGRADVEDESGRVPEPVEA